MTRIVYLRNPPENLPIVITLTILGTAGHYFWHYDNSFLVVGEGTTSISITLINKTDDHSDAFISDYATTGISGKIIPIEHFSISKDKQSANFDLSLLPNQMISFGVFVNLLSRTGEQTLIFCDPQASNDPKLRD